MDILSLLASLAAARGATPTRRPAMPQVGDPSGVSMMSAPDPMSVAPMPSLPQQQSQGGGGTNHLGDVLDMLFTHGAFRAARSMEQNSHNRAEQSRLMGVFADGLPTDEMRRAFYADPTGFLSNYQKANGPQDAAGGHTIYAPGSVPIGGNVTAPLMSVENGTPMTHRPGSTTIDGERLPGDVSAKDGLIIDSHLGPQGSYSNSVVSPQTGAISDYTPSFNFRPPAMPQVGATPPAPAAAFAPPPGPPGGMPQVGQRRDAQQSEAAAMFARNRQWAKPQQSYQTALPAADEAKFRQWVQANHVPFDPGDPQSDYDMRGYWRDVVTRGQSQTAVNQNDGQLHFPDTYKTPFHHSFSNESRYATPGAPRWANDHQLVDPATGATVFDERPARDGPPPPPAPPGVDEVIRTVYAEGDPNPAGWQAVAGVIANRARQSGKTPAQIVAERHQFEGYGNRRFRSLQPGTPAYQAVAEAITPVLQGQTDPTGGADSFYAPHLQSQLGRSAPAWDDGSGRTIGTQRFFNGKYGGARPMGNPRAIPQVGGGPPATGPVSGPTTAADGTVSGQGGIRQLTPGTPRAPRDHWEQINATQQRNTVTGEVKSSGGQNPGRMGQTGLAIQHQDVEAIRTASSINSQIDTIINQLDTGQLRLGAWENFGAGAENAVGMSDQNARNIANFNATVEQMRNDFLLLNKGVQTEGDARRAMAGLLSGRNDPKTVREQLLRIKRINEMQIAFHQDDIDQTRTDSGLEPIDVTRFRSRPQSPAGARDGAGTAPATAAGQGLTPEQAAKLPPGTHFRTMDGRDMIRQ